MYLTAAFAPPLYYYTPNEFCRLRGGGGRRGKKERDIESGDESILDGNYWVILQT